MDSEGRQKELVERWTIISSGTCLQRTNTNLLVLLIWKMVPGPCIIHIKEIQTTPNGPAENNFKTTVSSWSV